VRSSQPPLPPTTLDVQQALQARVEMLEEALHYEKCRAESSWAEAAEVEKMREGQQTEFRQQSTQLGNLRLQLTKATRRLQAQQQKVDEENRRSQSDAVTMQELQEKLEAANRVKSIAIVSQPEARAYLEFAERRLQSEESLARRLEKATRDLLAPHSPAIAAACAAVASALGEPPSLPALACTGADELSAVTVASSRSRSDSKGCSARSADAAAGRPQQRSPASKLLTEEIANSSICDSPRGVKALHMRKAPF